MKEMRISIAAIVMVLIFLGIVMIYSASGVYAMEQLGDSFYFLKRHVLFLLLGSVFSIGAMVIDYRILQRFAKPALLFGIFLLVLVLIPSIGKEINGARRWFKLGLFYFQPSEFLKLAVLIYTADFISRKTNEIQSFWRGYLPIMMVTGVVCALILKQPDLGSTLLIGTVVSIMILVGGVRLKYMGYLAMLAVPAVYFLVIRVPYRWARIKTFIDPWQDPLGAGFQLTQSQIALGRGGLLGVGLGHSMQKLFYLPAAHTDFILSIIGEELGFIGAFAVILLFAGFIWQGGRIAKRIEDPFGYFLSIGIVSMIGLQAIVNVGVSIGALPTKGLPLPFISYGGSALIFNMIAVALLLNISRINDVKTG